MGTEMGYTQIQNSGLFWISESDLIYNGLVSK